MGMNNDVMCVGSGYNNIQSRYERAAYEEDTPYDMWLKQSFIIFFFSIELTKI
mgnify:CR=1 FL=1